MTTIYVVTHGSYSDKGIEAMFSTRELAQAYIDRRNEQTTYSDLNDIEEYPLDAVSTEWLEGSVKCWLVQMARDSADITRIEEYNDGAPEDSQWDWNHNRSSGFATRLYADTQERAAKIAMERHAVWLANRDLVEAQS